MKKIPQLSDEVSTVDPDDTADPAARATPAEPDPTDAAEEADTLVSVEPLAVARPEATPRGGKAKGRGDQGGQGGKGGGSRSRQRRFARERALQALYQWDLAAAESTTVRTEFLERQDMSRVDVEYFERLFRGVSHDVESVDAALAEALDRPIAELDPIERAVLRIAAWELANAPETPVRVIINEGVEITKRFGADNGHRYVNGVLDRLAGQLRPLEMRRG